MQDISQSCVPLHTVAAKQQPSFPLPTKAGSPHKGFSMEFAFTAEEQAFREEIRQFLRDHPPDNFPHDGMA